MAIQLFESRQLLFKKESSEGVDPTPTGGSNALLSMNGSVSIEASKVERHLDRSFFGARPFKLVGRKATIQFDLEMVGAAAAGSAAPMGPVLECCGHSQTLVAVTSATYAPITDAIPSGTFYFYWAGLLFKALGSRGNMELELNIKGYWVAKFTFTGIVTTAILPSEAAAPSVTLTAWQDPPVSETETMALTINSGVALASTKFMLNQNNDVQIHEHSEGRQVLIMQREASGVITCYLPALATFNPWSIANAHTYVDVSVIVNGGAGKICTFTAATLQLELPKVVELQKGMGLEIPFVLPPLTAGSDYSIVFT